MLLDLIGRFAGEALANEVANALVHSRRPAAVPQRTDASVESGRNSVSRRLVALMESNLDFPLSLLALAEELGIAPRTLSHLCKQVFGESPMRLYLRIRLQAARNFLF